MTRFLLLLAIAWMLLLALERGLARLRAGSPAARRPVGPPPDGARDVVPLVRCAACEVYVPRTRALASPGGGTDRYCSERCLAAARPASA